MSIEIVGIEATMAAIGDDIIAFELEIDGLIQDAGMECEDLAIAGAAVDTGEMRDATAYLPGYLECEVVNDSDHSVYIEFGTSKMPPQPFMFPAYETAKQHLLQGIGG